MPSPQLSPEQLELVERIVEATVQKREAELLRDRLLAARSGWMVEVVGTGLSQADLARATEARLLLRDGWTPDTIKGAGVLLDSIRKIIKASRTAPSR